MKSYAWIVALAIITLPQAIPARAQDDAAAELAKKLANPIASLISVPLQYNYDEYGGLNDGASVSRLNIQPVIPFSLSDDWKLITRTIVPLVDQHGFRVDEMNESGLGDIVASQFFSPKAPTAGGWIWGAVHGRNAVPSQWVESLLKCRPAAGQPNVRHPRPECFWPVDTLELTERLLVFDQQDTGNGA